MNTIVFYFSLLVFSYLGFSQETRYIHVDITAAQKFVELYPHLAQVVSDGEHISVLKIKDSDKEIIASKLHTLTGKCGNFTDEGANQEHAIQLMQAVEDRAQIVQQLFMLNIVSFPSISRQSEVNALLPLVKEASIRFYIDLLSSYPTRFHQSAYSHLAVERLAGIWKHLIS